MKHISRTLCLGMAIVATSAWAQYKGDLTLTGGRFARYESLDYGSAALTYRLTTNVRLALRMTSSKTAVFDGGGFSVAHGGKDREAMGYFSPSDHPDVEIGVGLAAPDTTDRNQQVQATFDLGWKRTARHIQLRFGLRGVLTGSEIAMASLQALAPVGPAGFSLDVEGGVTTWGENARSSVNGKAISLPIGKLGIRFDQNGPLHAEIALTNQLGATTGFGMTPTLGNRYGLSLSAGVRF
ncbi:MAG TPA: hypothetical protein VHE55_12470 [Fimbriimonadaceae bacterium]|nr:hypothetical protein [Fimbriimonadaceae bacterium]